MLSWFQTPEADRIDQTAKDKAWRSFLAKYSNADKSEFVAQTDFNNNNKATSDYYFFFLFKHILLAKFALREKASSVQTASIGLKR